MRQIPNVHLSTSIPSSISSSLISGCSFFTAARIRARGQKTGGSVPYGYRLDVDGRTLVAVEGEQATIARARLLSAEGRSLRAVAAQLADEGHVSRGCRRFAAAQVARMLRARNSAA